MKDLLFTNWHIMRIFRLAFALFLFAQAYYTHEWYFIAFGLFFLFQAIFNSGCGPNGCSVPKNKYTKK
jgi:VanZ family protein